METAGIASELRIPGTSLAIIPNDITNLIAALLRFKPYRLDKVGQPQPICDSRAKTVLVSYEQVGSVLTYDHRWTMDDNRPGEYQTLYVAGTHASKNTIEVPGGRVKYYGSGICIESAGNQPLYSQYPFTDWCPLMPPGFSIVDTPQPTSTPPHVYPYGYYFPGNILDEIPIDRETQAYLCAVKNTTAYKVVMLENATGRPVRELHITNNKPNLDCLAKCGDLWILYSSIATAKKSYTTITIHNNMGHRVATIDSNDSVPYRIIPTADPNFALALYCDAIGNHAPSTASTLVKAIRLKITRVAGAKFY